MNTSKDITLHNEAIRSQIRRLKKRRSYPDLELIYGINRKYLWHFVNTEGYEPPETVAAIIGWIKYKEVPICPIHGVVHLSKCPGDKPKPKKRRRRAVSLTNAQSAAKSIVGADRAYDIDELIRALQDELEDQIFAHWVATGAQARLKGEPNE